MLLPKDNNHFDYYIDNNNYNPIDDHLNNYFDNYNSIDDHLNNYVDNYPIDYNFQWWIPMR